MTILVLTGNANINSTTWVPGQPGNNGFLVGIRLQVTNAATAGTMTFNVSWTDPTLGATTHSELLVLTALGLSDNAFPIYVSANTAITYSLTLAGVIGAPAYNIVLMYSGAS